MQRLPVAKPMAGRFIMIVLIESATSQVILQITKPFQKAALQTVVQFITIHLAQAVTSTATSQITMQQQMVALFI
jgi:hypothetical protein